VKGADSWNSISLGRSGRREQSGTAMIQPAQRIPVGAADNVVFGSRPFQGHGRNRTEIQPVRTRGSAVEAREIRDRAMSVLSKRESVEEMLKSGMTQIVLDSRAKGCVLPTHLLGNPELRINLSHNFEGKLLLDDDTIVAELSFKGVVSLCVIPWKAVYVAFSNVVDQFGAAWPEDAPPESLMYQVAGKPPQEEEDVFEGKRYGHLRVVK